MILYGIRHIPSRRLLCRDAQHARSKKVGVTHAEFENDGVPYTYASVHGAKTALAQWLKGEQSVVMSAGAAWPETDELAPDAVERWVIEPKPHRKAEEVEVVELKIKVRSLKKEAENAATG